MQDNIDTLFKEYNEQLENLDKDLANEMKEMEGKIAAKESEISNKDIEISSKNNDVATAERELSSATSERECLEQSLSSLKAADTSNMSEEQKTKIQTQIKELENDKIPAAKQKEEAAKEKLNSENQALEKLKDEKTTFETELSELNSQKTKLDAKITEKYPEVQQAQKAYNDSKNEYNQYKTTEVTNAQSDVKASQDRIKEVQAALDKAENKEIESKYKTSGLESKYNLNGENFDVVKMEGFNTLEEFQNFILSKGMTNKGKGGNDWPMQCHNFSNEYGDIMLGTSKIDLNSGDAAAQAAKGRDRQFKNVYCDTYDTAYAVIAAELDAGRPVVARIRTPGKNMNHYGLICGIREGADRNNLKQSDFLYIDSYGGTISALGKTRELIGCQGSVHVWQGKDYNFEYKDQHTYNKRYRTAEEVRRAYGLA
jgi:chemotaxis protein histidine kinase CheA